MRIFLFTLIVVFSGILGSTVARAQGQAPQPVPVHCPPSAIQPPSGQTSLFLATGNGNAYEFRLVPADGVVITDQQWKYPGHGSVDNTGGTWAGGDGQNVLAWNSPSTGGTFSVSVKAKRHCGGMGGGGGGAAVDEDFEVDWGGSTDVKAQYRSNGPIILFSVPSTEQSSGAGTTPADGAKVSAGQTIEFLIVMKDPDERKVPGEDWKQFYAPEDWGTYTLTIQATNATFLDAHVIDASLTKIRVDADRIAPGAFALTTTVIVNPDWDGNTPVDISISVDDQVTIPVADLSEGSVNDLRDPIGTYPLHWTKADTLPQSVEAIWQDPPGISVGKPGVGTEHTLATPSDTITVQHQYGPNTNGHHTNYNGVTVDETFPDTGVSTSITSLNDINANLRAAHPEYSAQQLVANYLSAITRTSTFNIGGDDTTTDGFGGLFPESLLSPRGQRRTQASYTVTQQYECPPGTVLNGGTFHIVTTRHRSQNGAVTTTLKRY